MTGMGKRKNRTEMLVCRAYGDPNENEITVRLANQVRFEDSALRPGPKADDVDGPQDDDASSIAGSMGSSDANKTGKRGDDQELEKVKLMLTEGKDEQAVRRWRIVVVACLVLMGIAITAATCVFLMQHDETQYQAAYTVVTSNVKAVTKRRVTKMREAFQRVSHVVAASAVADKMEWPFVTMTREPYEVLARHARDESGAEVLSLSPFVEDTQRKDWLKYSFDNAWWFDQSKQVVEQMAGTGDNVAGIYANVSFAPDLFGPNGNAPILNGTERPSSPTLTGLIPHAALWQVSPPPYFPGIVNMDFFTFHWFVPMFPALDHYRESFITNVYDLTRAVSLSRGHDAHRDYHQQFSSRPLTVNETLTHPHSVVITPISERFQDKTSRMVGMLVATTSWDWYIAGLLPTDSLSGIMVELVNNCNQSFTYLLNGSKASYLGSDNFHNLTFADSRFVVDLFDPPGDRPDEGYDRYGDGSNYCDYSIIVYSTQEFKDSISTNTAVSFTLIVAGVSALVVLTFLVYDCYVRRRNTKVVEAAVRSDQILMSHFPSNVRARLYEAQQNQEKEASAARGIGAKNRLRHFLNGADTPVEAAETETAPPEVLGFEGKPIADL
jgi:hypothetical protein